MAQTQSANRAAAVMGSPWRSRARIPSILVAVASILVVLAVLHHILVTTPSRGLAIRDALIAAAAKTKSLPPNEAGDAIRSALAPYFRNFDAVIDPSRFPGEIDVTLRNLDGVSCLEAEDVARRIEGLVVVQLDQHEAAGECGQKNAMTWRLLP